MITIHLQNLKFYSFHGVHEEERILGNNYVVNADIHFNEESAKITSLSQTINYAEIFDIIKKRMLTPSELLESIAMDIGNQIYQKYSYVRSINITLKKVHPPIQGIEGSVSVTWHKEF